MNWNERKDDAGPWATTDDGGYVAQWPRGWVAKAWNGSGYITLKDALKTGEEAKALVEAHFANSEKGETVTP